jgi:RNA polymerase sigma factor (sigma-70 family)
LTPDESKLVSENIGLAYDFALKKERCTRTLRCELDDIRSIACLGLIKAARTYDSSKGAFCSWAWLHMKSQLRVLLYKNEIETRTLTRADSSRPDYEVEDLASEDPSRSSENMDVKRMLETALERTTPKQAYVLTEHFVQKRKLYEIASEMGVTKQAVSKILCSGLVAARGVQIIGSQLMQLRVHTLILSRNELARELGVSVEQLTEWETKPVSTVTRSDFRRLCWTCRMSADELLSALCLEREAA